MDEIVRMIAADGTVRAVAITGKDMAERARQIHLPVLEVAPGIPMAVRHSCNTAQGASALNAQGD